MSTVPAPPAVEHNAAARRFEVRLGEDLAHLDYRMDGPAMRIVHTEVPPAFEGQGVASRIVRAALDWAEAEKLQVRPDCSYVRAWLRRHPEAQGLLAPGSRL